MNKVLSTDSNEIISVKMLKIGIWAYFILLIFEGALRKWFLPGLSTPLLVVRDPIAIWLIYICWKKNLLPSNFYLLGMSFIGLLGVITALLFGHGSLSVAIFGARILLIHFPIMFIIGTIFDREDVIQIGRILLWISIPMAVLIALQFYSPQSAWVNRGIGGDIEGAGFSGSQGYFRPPGTFSFTSGNVLYFSFTACYVFYFWISQTKINKYILIGSTVALFASIPLSISRTLLFSIIITFIFTLIATIGKTKFLIRMILSIIIGSILLLVLSQTPFFQVALGAFTERFINANNTEGGVSSSIADRVFGGMITAITDSNDLPFFGYGLGMGTNAGSALLTGKRTFLIAEGEWLRFVGELGFVMGIIALLIRILFCIDISIKSFKILRLGDILPWILLSFGLMLILRGQWAQPTVLGFSTLIGGLILASTKNKITI